MNATMIVSTKIRQIRHRLNLTQEALGQLVGRGAGSIGHYEAGRQVPPADVYQAILDLDALEEQIQH